MAETPGWRALLVIALLLAAGSSVAADAPNDTRETLIGLEQAWSDAYARHDVEAIANLLSEDYVGVDGRGLVSARRDELAEAAPPSPTGKAPAFEILKESLSDFRVRQFSEMAIVNAINTVSARIDGQPRTIRYRRTTVWQRTSGSWKCVAFHASQIREA
jgi:ketosteroid isomerase-like protein